MRMRNLPWALPALCLALASAPALLAQDAPQQAGQQGDGRGFGGGMGMGMVGNSAHGTVTAISGTDITIRDEQGQSYKVLTGPNTRVMKDRDPVKVTDIKVGDSLVAMGNLDDQAKTLGAMFVMVLTPEQAARMEKMRADFGKTWTAGKITAIKDLTLSIERPDKVTQTITVDENTTFHKRNEDITFPDFKVGDMVRATGALQNGSFLATNLTAVEPGGRGPGRGGPGGPGRQPGQPSAQQPPPPPSGATPPQPPNVPQN
jgi:Domain of unknown function (DUF5666)